jgi:hypothetical protein
MTRHGSTHVSVLLADAYGNVDEPEEGLTHLDEATRIVEVTKGRCVEAEIPYSSEVARDCGKSGCGRGKPKDCDRRNLLAPISVGIRKGSILPDLKLLLDQLA